MKPPEDSMREIKCIMRGEPIKVKVGEVFFHAFHRHGSVGEEAEFEIGDENIISHISSKTEYLHPEKLKPGWTGGDAERGQWLFKAEKQGTTTFKFRKLFRFKVESECTMTINVV